MLTINSRIFLVLVMIGAMAGCGGAGETITRLAVGTPGPDPYSPMAGTDQVQMVARTQVGATTKGDEPGLYGGTRRDAACDPAMLVEFLLKNPEKAKAWAAAHRITTGEIQAFVGRLTPVLLRTDTLVTNHGYRDGKPTSSPAVLQAGMGVLVNEYGFPVVKCNCGNPLTEPAKKISTGKAKYTGQSWKQFSKGKVTKIEPREPSKGAVPVFVLVDPQGTVGFNRPRATTGDLDGPAVTPPVEVPESGDPSSGPSTVPDVSTEPEPTVDPSVEVSPSTEPETETPSPEVTEPEPEVSS